MNESKINFPKRKDYNAEIEAASKFSYCNEALLQDIETAGCYFCCQIYTTSIIKEWCDKGKTALCPRCGVDSVIPNTEGALTHSRLRALHLYNFQSGSIGYKMKDGKLIDVTDEDGCYDEKEFAEFRQQELNKPRRERKVI